MTDRMSHPTKLDSDLDNLVANLTAALRQAERLRDQYSLASGRSYTPSDEAEHRRIYERFRKSGETP
jgi:hypothetical protein